MHPQFQVTHRAMAPTGPLNGVAQMNAPNDGGHSVSPGSISNVTSNATLMAHPLQQGPNGSASNSPSTGPNPSSRNIINGPNAMNGPASVPMNQQFSQQQVKRNGSSTPTGTTFNAPRYGTPIPNRIFVGGISQDTTETDLIELFSRFGDVKAAKIIVDRAGISKGYGFVTFSSEEEAKNALNQASDNLEFKERRLNIAMAVKKQTTIRPPMDGAMGIGFPYPGMAFSPYPPNYPAIFDPNTGQAYIYAPSLAGGGDLYSPFQVNGMMQPQIVFQSPPPTPISQSHHQQQHTSGGFQINGHVGGTMTSPPTSLHSMSAPSSVGSLPAHSAATILSASGLSTAGPIPGQPGALQPCPSPSGHYANTLYAAYAGQPYYITQAAGTPTVSGHHHAHPSGTPGAPIVPPPAPTTPVNAALNPSQYFTNATYATSPPNPNHGLQVGPQGASQNQRFVAQLQHPYSNPNNAGQQIIN